MFDSLTVLLILIPGLPLAAALATAALGPWLLKDRSHWPTLVALSGSLVCSLILLLDVGRSAEHLPRSAIGYEEVRILWNWVDVDEAMVRTPAPDGSDGAAAPVASPGKQPGSRMFDFNVEIALRADPLTAVMLLMVTLVSMLVAVYSVGYMHGDPGYWRFFTYIPLFVFSMTMLVSASNFVLLYVFWEAVGACSYLLIGFWYHKPSAAAAGKKAFLVNRVGDFGFALALFLIWTNFGTLNFHDTTTSDGALVTPGVFGQARLGGGDSVPDDSPGQATSVGGGIVLAICLLLMLGACGKSAQIPLHVWLPDAMEGPTPVSALIHAATMVTAGVYMVVRCTPLFMASPEAQLVVAIIGTATAAVAGLIALTQTDLKRVLAYSTISQLGYMFLALGTGTLAGITAGMFHLFTHAFFKALLFLGAGSVMHAMGGVIDMRRFGGLKRLMPATYWTFLVGALALAGFPFLSGFWSKDAILGATADLAHGDGRFHVYFEYLYWTAMGTALLTALYTFRAVFLTFHGPERIPAEAGHHADESPASMTVPLALLAVFAAGIGALLHLGHGFVDFLGKTPSLAFDSVQRSGHAGPMHMDVAVTSGATALVGIALAAYFYLGGARSETGRVPERATSDEAELFARVFRPLYQIMRGKFFFDEMYTALVVWPLRAAAAACSVVDRYLVDGVVNAVGRIPPLAGASMRPLQGGLLQFYALAMVLGLLVLALGLFVRGA